MSFLAKYDYVRKEQAKLQGLDDASDASDASKESNDINLEKKIIIKYESMEISGYTIFMDILCMDAYEKNYIQFDKECIYVVVYIPFATVDNFEIFDNTVFQLFTSDEMNNNKVMYHPFTPDNSYDDEISLLKFDNIVSFQSIVVQTMEYIKFIIKSKYNKKLILNMKSLNLLKYDLDGENHYDLDDRIQHNEVKILSNIDYHNGMILNKQQILLECEKEFIFEESEDELKLVSHFAFEIDNTTDKLCVRNIDLEKIQKEHVLEAKMNCIECTELYLDELIIPDINENDTYKVNEERFNTLRYVCEDTIENLSVFAEDDKSDKLCELLALLALLESKKLLIEAKMTELKKLSSILLAKDKHNARIVSLTEKITELLEQEHDTHDYESCNYEFMKYYLGYKNMIKTIKSENIIELLDKIPLLEAKQKEEEEKAKFLKISF